MPADFVPHSMMRAPRLVPTHAVFGAVFGFGRIRHHALVLGQRLRNKHRLDGLWKHLHRQQRQEDARRGGR